MLSDTKIRTLKPDEKMYRVLDAERLYIEVRPTGKKVWRLKYSLDGKEGSISFGDYPAISLAEARKKKDEVKAQLAKGLNPVQQKKLEKLDRQKETASTFKAIAEEYATEKMQYKSEDYVTRFKGCMEKDVYPVIGRKPIKEVSAADILEIMRDTVTRVRKDAKYGTGEAAANLNRRFIGLVMRYAIITSRAEYDPSPALKGAIEQPEVENARPLEKGERQQLRSRLDSYGGTTTVKNAGLAMLYSMLRTVEIRRMKWQFVDFENRIVTFPKASKRKVQERSMKKNRVHIVPMSNQLYDLLQLQFKITGEHEYVFTSPYKWGCMLSASAMNKMLMYVGLDEVTAHDFRATASTLLNEKGYETDWIEKQLAHAEDNKTRASYNHARWLDDRRNMLQDWADIVDSWGEI
ncbi:tyrosine-type recombinase/integrase [Acinetobacter dispersus]|uniref:tyrosine-type recombinase/integrase n=1 Tax=Acinetobacter dispersus TaxID=70348 RepID=UPI001F4AB337|nr:integrase arm-type DNA-binding domain-containing protein [Acinetobacter dispersus]MCH7391802.1 integrase arm-type DNA-binding domain-containing protein [Acinetobacter dispersus]